MEKPSPRDATVFCPRLEQPRAADEHLRCVYCFGRAAEVRRGDRQAFCDFRPGVDPTSFGFPAEGERFQCG